MGNNSSTQESERQQNIEHEKKKEEIRLAAEREITAKIEAFEKEKLEKLAALDKEKSERIAVAQREASKQQAAERAQRIEMEVAIERERIVKEAEVNVKRIQAGIEKVKTHSHVLTELGRLRMKLTSGIRETELNNRHAADNKEKNMMIIMMAVIVGGVVIGMVTGNFNGASALALLMAIIVMIGGYTVVSKVTTFQIQRQELTNEMNSRSPHAIQDEFVTNLAAKLGDDAQQVPQKPAIGQKADDLKGATKEQGARASTEQATTSA